MPPILIIGAGGVGSVATQKCAADPATFPQICLASRTLDKCEAIADRCGRPIRTEQLDADDPKAVAEMIRKTGAKLVLNLALPYQDLTIMEGCLEAGAHYLDTANYEHPDTAEFNYGPQWALHEQFEKAGLMALLGCGFDPGVTQVYCAHAFQHHFDTIETIDILDCNAGDNGLPFATNFNPEINIREVTAPSRHYEDGEWVETPALATHHPFDFPAGIGEREVYQMYHEEMESLIKHIPGIRRIRFWMTFSESYLRHLKVLENVGMTGIAPIEYEGHEIVPLQFLKAVLPKPDELGAVTKGKTCIGCLITGVSDGHPKSYYIYNTCDHEACNEELGSQAVAYTTGVPAMVGAKLMLRGDWMRAGVFNVEQLDPDPFLREVAKAGLPWKEEIDEREMAF